MFVEFVEVMKNTMIRTSEYVVVEVVFVVCLCLYVYEGGEMQRKRVIKRIPIFVCCLFFDDGPFMAVTAGKGGGFIILMK